MYTDEVQLNTDNVMHIMYAAKKYIITNLSKKCSEFLYENLSADTAPQILEHSIIFDENDLKEKVLTTIVEEAPAVLSSEEFTALSKETLHEVLQLNLKINSEMEVFNASLKWAESRCKQLKRTMDGANVRKVLGDSLFLIRFPTMTIDDINDAIIPQDILIEQEQLHILHYLTAKSKNANLPFPLEPRFDCTPRDLLIPPPYDAKCMWLSTGYSHTFSTTLKCFLSLPVQITKIFIHPFHRGGNTNVKLTLTLTQNGKTLFNYAGKPDYICESNGTYRRFVQAKDACVEGGALQLDIQLWMRNDNRNSNCYDLQFSSQATTNMSDNFVSMEFTAVDENLLLGLEYSPVI